eukprot:1296617-Pyramimonas_sp.AAC.1
MESVAWHFGHRGSTAYPAHKARSAVQMAQLEQAWIQPRGAGVNFLELQAAFGMSRQRAFPTSHLPPTSRAKLLM